MKRGRLKVRACVRDIQPYQPGKPVEEVERELGIRGAVKLASNENSRGPAPRVIQALKQAAASAGVYPDAGCYYLRQALGQHLKLRAEEIIIGNGSNELLVLLGLALLEPGDEVLTSQMSFVVYYSVPRLMNAKLIAVPMRKYQFDLEAIARAITRKTRIIFIANPNNPTGTTVAPAALRKFIEKVPQACLVVLDEAYYEYADSRIMGQSLDLVRERENIVVLRTFSKAYGLAGLRIGYGAAPRIIVDAIERVREPFNVNYLAQVGAKAALEASGHMRRSVELARSERSRMGETLAGMGFKTVPSQTNFIFAQAPIRDSQKFSRDLMRKGIIIRPFAGSHVRITMGTRVQNNQMIRAVKQVLGSCKK